MSTQARGPTTPGRARTRLDSRYPSWRLGFPITYSPIAVESRFPEVSRATGSSARRTDTEPLSLYRRNRRPMSSARRLSTHSRHHQPRPSAGSTIDALSDCAQACTADVDDDLSERNLDEIVKSIRLCLDPAISVAQMRSKPPDGVRPQRGQTAAEACASACKSCECSGAARRDAPALPGCPSPADAASGPAGTCWARSRRHDGAGWLTGGPAAASESLPARRCGSDRSRGASPAWQLAGPVPSATVRRAPHDRHEDQPVGDRRLGDLVRDCPVTSRP